MALFLSPRFFLFAENRTMKSGIFIPIILVSLAAASQTNELRIRKILDDQVAQWNKGNIDSFMNGYWKNDSLMFIGKNGISRGWQTALNNYKRTYPDTASMGRLTFDIVEVKQLSAEYYYVVGKWMLKRRAGDLRGYYNLLFQKIGGQWFIVADHSS